MCVWLLICSLLCFDEQENSVLPFVAAYAYVQFNVCVILHPMQLHLKTMPHLMYKLITGQVIPVYH